MKLGAAISLANREQLADANLNLSQEAAFVIVPQFLRDIRMVIGWTWWQWNTWSASVVASDRNIDLPNDWKRFRQVKTTLSDGTLSREEMRYIGDDEERVLVAEAATIAAAPCEYYIVRVSGVPKLRLAAPSDGAYTLRGSYDWQIPVSATADPDLTDYIPLDTQGLLVLRIRMAILADRLGDKDSRYLQTEQEYRNGVESLSPEAEAAPRRRVLSMN